MLQDIPVLLPFQNALFFSSLLGLIWIYLGVSLILTTWLQQEGIILNLALGQRSVSTNISATSVKIQDFLECLSLYRGQI